MSLSWDDRLDALFDEHDTRDVVRQLLAEAWAIGYQDACDEMGSTCLLDGPADWRNPFVEGGAR